MSARVTEERLVLEAAAECFAQRGFEETTIEEVAERAAVSRATVYRYVGNKQALVARVTLEEAANLIEVVGDALKSADTVDELVRTGVASALRVINDRPLMLRMAGPDLERNLPLFTTDSLGLVRVCVDGLWAVLEPMQGHLLPAIGPVLGRIALEEMVRFVLCRVHTPTLDGDNRDPEAAAERASLMLTPSILATFR